jgi:hypothetical protein
MTKLEVAFNTILGYCPQYMRPPFLNANSVVTNTMATLKYKVITVDIDTLDWQNTSPTLIQQSITNYQNGLNNGGTMELSHDPLINTVHTLAPAMIAAIKAKGKTCK